jgi:hypothetical protein
MSAIAATVMGFSIDAKTKRLKKHKKYKNSIAKKAKMLWRRGCMRLGWFFSEKLK